MTRLLLSTAALALIAAPSLAEAKKAVPASAKHHHVVKKAKTKTKTTTAAPAQTKAQ
ncbi:hypothetical protein [Sphingomonas sp. DT-204]|uniref:hypothetical protein n=1 Tax=Sphingomonas sp. DT-204 TaxID=3396166 RepID=UPI003F1D8B16